MKFPNNMEEVATLQPDFLGFIFYEKSPRNLEHSIPKISENIKKVGVFVNASIPYILEKIATFHLDLVQLHGDENEAFCKALKKQSNVEIIKVFSINDTFSFSTLDTFESVCDYFLFDTKGKYYGGNGTTFNWKILENYPSTKPYFLSGGIGLELISNLKQFLTTSASQHCYAIDINSQFEKEPGLKDTQLLKQFKNELQRK